MVLMLPAQLLFPGGTVTMQHVVSSFSAHSQVLICYESNGFMVHTSNILRVCEHIFVSGKSWAEMWKY